jgi:exonuclease III
MTGINTYLSILTLTVSRFNSPIKRHHLTNWIKKEDPKICCLQETHLIDKSKHRLRVKGWKKIYQANVPPKQAGVDLNHTLIKRDKEGHSILIKWEIHQKDITIINLCALNVNAPNFIKHTLKDIKTYINSNTVVVGDFNNPVSPIDRSSKQNINKETLELNHAIDQMDLADVYKIFHPTSTQYTYFSAAHGTFSKIGHTLGHKASLSKHKKIEIIPCILSGHNALKLELTNKNNSKKHANSWKHIAQ